MSRAKTLAKARSQARRRPNAGTPPRTVPFLAGPSWSAVLCVLLAATTIALYSPVIGHSFIVLDDSDYVTSNLHVRAGLRWSTIKWAFTATTAANWHPLTWLSHALDCQLFGLNAAGHHFDNVLIHALNVVLVFLILRWFTGRVGPSLLVAALFAWHPINVESVAWVAERKNLLSTVFFLGSIGAYGWYARKISWLRYFGVTILFVLGLMAKPMVITLPFILLLLDYWPLGRTPGSPASATGASRLTISALVFEKLPLLALSAVSGFVTIAVQRSGYAVRTLHQFSLAARVENAVVAYALYLWKMMWPVRLAFGYPFPAAGRPAWQWVLSSLILAGITSVVVIFRSHRYLLVGWLWFLGMLVPVIGLVQVGDAAMADRYAYLPLIGIFIIVAWGGSDLASKKNIGPFWLAIPTACVLIALSIITNKQISYWDSEYDLWSHTLEVTGNPFADDALGAALMDPETALSRKNLDTVGSDQQRMEEARRHFEAALSERRELSRQNPDTYLPDMAVTLNNLGNLERIENNLDLSRHYYEEGLQIHARLAKQNLDFYPADRAMALMNLAYLERSKLENDRAMLHFSDALAIYRQLAKTNPEQFLPNVAEALNGLAVTERDETRMDDARRHYEEALRIRRSLVKENRAEYLPYLAMTLNDIGVLDGAERRNTDAHIHYEEALKVYRELAAKDPDLYMRYLAGTLNNLAFLDGNENRTAESRSYYTEALRLYRELYQSEPSKYAADVARVESELEGLEQKTNAKKASQR